MNIKFEYFILRKNKVSSHPTLQFTKIQLSIRDAFSYVGHAYPYMQKGFYNLEYFLLIVDSLVPSTYHIHHIGMTSL